MSIRRALFGDSKDLNDGITDYQLMQFIQASLYADEHKKHGASVNLGTGGFFGYHLRLTCKASTVKDDSYKEYNFEDDIRSDILDEYEKHLEENDSEDEEFDEDDEALYKGGIPSFSKGDQDSQCAQQ